MQQGGVTMVPMFVLLCYTFLFGSSCASLLGSLALDNVLKLDKHQAGVFGQIAKMPHKLCHLTTDTTKDVSKVKIHWYGPKAHKGWVSPVHKAAKKLGNENSFKLSHDLVLIYPGFNTPHKNFADIFLTGYKDLRPHTNILFVDHYAYTHSSFMAFKSYLETLHYMHSISYAVAEFVAELVKIGQTMTRIHVVGHSFGAQSTGVLGQYFKAITGDKLPRCTGLDPCGPCINTAPYKHKINREDCDFVDCYHTNEGQMGTYNNVCDVDFYPNGNFSTQPGCETKKGLLKKVNPDMACSHLRAIALWLEAVKNCDALAARKCDCWDDFKNGKCSKRSIIRGGLKTPCDVKGNYIFRTKSKADYTLGRAGADPGTDCDDSDGTVGVLGL